MPHTRRLLADRFWPKVEKTEGCWLWRGTIGASGYGKIRATGPSRAMLTAHRVSWELAYGPIPEGLWALHKCDIRPCVRPDHLFLGTRQDNMDDAKAKGRIYHPPSLLSDADKRLVSARVDAGESIHSIAADFRVPTQSAYRYAWKVRGHGLPGRRMAKLTMEKAAQIRALAANGTKQRDIARMFGVSPANVCLVVAGKAWRTAA